MYQPLDKKTNKYSTDFGTEYQNDLTKEIDKYLLPSLIKFNGINTYKHRTYILVDDIGCKDHTFAIRCPGMTIGEVKFIGFYPNTQIISSIVIDTENKALGMSYNVDELTKADFSKFINKKLELKERYWD